MRTPKEFRRWMLLHREPVDNWTQGRVTLLGDAAHFMLQYMAQGAAMAMEDAVCLGACVDEADGDFEESFSNYQRKRIVRASRVQISANRLIGMIFHVPDGVERVVRNAIFGGRSVEQHYDALDWVFSAPDYVRNFSEKTKRASARAPTVRAHAKHRLRRRAKN
jgi:salicylate hydroxylase